uniref:Uncharacterized protein n=1 Tax=Arundo donax TaxID=35708 RepID=A0A0A8ZR71_ARUDO
MNPFSKDTLELLNLATVCNREIDPYSHSIQITVSCRFPRPWARHWILLLLS